MSLDLRASAHLDLGVMPSELDAGVAWRAAIGLVVLATDQTMEHEFRALLRLPGVAVFESRDRKSTRLNSSHPSKSRMPSSA